MNALMKVSQAKIGDETVNTVNARDLHEFLGVRSEFRNWIKNRISDYGFDEGKDFTTAVEFYRGGERKDYFITLDMAKELAMVERNEKGKQARQYFIECERRAVAFAALPDFTNPIIAARAWADEKERGDLNEAALREVQQKMLAAEPKLLALEKIAGCDNSMCITNAAKALQIQPKAFFQWLSEHQWIYRRSGCKFWISYQNRIQSGHLEHKVTTVERSDGSQKVVEQVLVTPKGLTRLAELLVSVRQLQAPSLN